MLRLTDIKFPTLDTRLERLSVCILAAILTLALSEAAILVIPRLRLPFLRLQGQPSVHSIVPHRSEMRHHRATLLAELDIAKLSANSAYLHCPVDVASREGGSPILLGLPLEERADPPPQPQGYRPSLSAFVLHAFLSVIATRLLTILLDLSFFGISIPLHTPN